MSKRLSLKDKALEKLGLGQRFKSHALDSDSIHTQDTPPAVTEPTQQPQFETLSPGSTISEKTLGLGPAVWCTNIAESILKSDMVETRLDKVRSYSDSEKRPRAKSQPARTIAYTVKDSDSLESIAAFYDTTPSELKNLNKLPSRMIFPGQVIYIPDGSSESPTASSPIQNPKEIDLFSDCQPKTDIPIVRMADHPPSKVPGHAERQTPVSSPTEDAVFEIPSKFSSEVAEKLDHECTERFIKIDVKYITDGQGVVSGVLLVTPNAVMFDPYMSDPLVIEHGPEKYGIMAPMDMIIRAAMYRDIAAMKYHKKKREGEELPSKPEVYHDKTCPLYSERIISQEVLKDQTQREVVEMPHSSTMTSEMSEASSVCSCGAGGKDVASVSDINKSPVSCDQNLTSQEPILFSLSDVSPEECSALTDNSNAPLKKMSTLKSSSQIVHKSTSISLEDVNENIERTKDGIVPEVFEHGSASVTYEHDSSLELTLDIGPLRTNGHSTTTDYAIAEEEDRQSGNTVLEPLSNDYKSEQDSLKTEATDISSKISNLQLAENDCAEISTNDAKGGDRLVTQEIVAISADPMTSSNKDRSSKEVIFEIGSVEKGGNDTTEQCSPNKDQSSCRVEMRIGNIVYLPVEEDKQGQITIKGMEETTEALLKLSKDDFEEKRRSKSESDSFSIRENKSTSSFSSFRAPPLSAFVNYATGLFRSEPSDRVNVKDIHEAWKAKREARDKVEVENAVKLADKPELFLSFDKLIPRPALAYEDPPLYLCLCLGNPINKEVSQTCPIQSYAKKKKKPEYWFSIPRNKVDFLYAFFVQWTPEIYGDEADMDPVKRGFIVIEDDVECFDDDKLKLNEEYFGTTFGLHKDWEIISHDEATKRRSIDMEEPLPLPDLIGDSFILTDFHIFQINLFLPPRTIGYPWSLIYSTEKHGFSLQTLYRYMQGIDSPTLLVVRDTNHNIFGAMLSCALKVSEHFYGTGESFLFSFYPDFKVFRWTGENNFFFKGNQESLSIGAGQGLFGLWFDGDLYHGRTNHCETYDNDLLTASEDFVVKTLEVWVFVQQ